jgi:hypothetical protein
LDSAAIVAGKVLQNGCVPNIEPIGWPLRRPFWTAFAVVSASIHDDNQPGPIRYLEIYHSFHSADPVKPGAHNPLQATIVYSGDYLTVGRPYYRLPWMKRRSPHLGPGIRERVLPGFRVRYQHPRLWAALGDFPTFKHAENQQTSTAQRIIVVSAGT